MIRSMTGVGSARKTTEEFDIEVRVRSINNRYLDLNLRLPAFFMEFELPLRQGIQQLLERGKVDIYFDIKDLRNEPAQVALNRPMVDAILTAAEYLRQRPEIEGRIDAATLLGINGILNIEAKKPENPDEMLAFLSGITETAIKDMIAMREMEGAHIQKDLQMRLKICRSLLAQVADQSGEVKEEYFKKLKERIAEFTDGLEVDKERMEQEVALIVDRSDITEEIVRLQSHIDQAEGFLSAGGPVGKKLDFLLQEMNREINTIGAKGRKTDLSKTVVEFKSELDKIREQVQNIE
jgi:uncharacterized protein (TIGR00255 family)